MKSFTKSLCLLFSLISLISAWQPGPHECPEALEVTIPNNSEYVSEGSRYGMIWDQFDNIGSGIATMEDVRTVLNWCPDITVLDLHPHASGCESFPDRYNIPWALDGTDTIPALESITLNEYDFDQREWGRLVPPQDFIAPTEDDTEHSWLAPWKVWFHSGRAERWFDIRGIPQEQREKSNLDLWLDQMDWSRLKSLTIKDDSEAPQGKALYERLPNMVPGLESLAVQGPWWETVDIAGELLEDGTQATRNIRRARDFILAFPKDSLKSLAWIKPDFHDGTDFQDILEHHGQGLTAFEWRDAEREDDRRPVLSLSQLRDMAASAPNLESLTIDLNRNGTWPMEELTAILEGFPKLRNLTVYFELVNDCYRGKEDDYTRSKICGDGCDGWDQFERPLLDKASAGELFEVLRERKVGDELQSATFRAGDWDPQDFGMLDSMTLLRDKTAFMDCTVLNEDGSRKAEGAATCQGTPTGMNRYERARTRWCEEQKYTEEKDYFDYHKYKDEL